jgi:hypothetical protein
MMEHGARRSWMRRHLPALLLVYAFKLGVGLALAEPLSQVLTGAGVVRFPEGDRLLFARGGMVLLETLRLQHGVLTGSLTSALILGGAASLLSLIPLAFLMVSLDAQGEGSLGDRAPRSLGAVGPFAFLGGLTVLVQALVGLAAAATVLSSHRAARAVLDERGADLAALGIGLAGLGAVLLVGILEDVARAEVVCHRYTGVRALLPACEAFARAPMRLVSRWGARALLTGGLVLLGGTAVTHLGLEHPGAWRVALAWTVHQTVIAGWILLRAAWLGDALAHVRPSPDAGGVSRSARPSPDDTAARSGAPDDPSRGRAA